MIINGTQWRCLDPPPKLLDDSIPFAEGLKLIAEIDIDPPGMPNDYIDGLISLAVDVEEMDMQYPAITM